MKLREGSGASSSRRAVVGFAAILAGLIVAWALADFFRRDEILTVTSARLRGGEAAASALARFFAALVLFLFPAGEAGERLRWVASGLVVLGIGHLAFGYVEPLIQRSPTDLNDSLYEGLLVRFVAGVLFVVGLVLREPPRMSWRRLGFILLLLAAGYVVAFETLENLGALPRLALISDLEAAADGGRPPTSWLTPWHWVFSGITLGLAVAAVAGAAHQYRRGFLPGWLLFGMVLLAGSQVHQTLWPDDYDSLVLTDADALRLAFAVVVAVGGVIELRRIASEREALLAVEKERTRRLKELASLKADFSAMVAHELGSPLSAMHRLADMLRVPNLGPEGREFVVSAIRKEVGTLDGLVDDVQAAATVERDDFGVMPRPVVLEELLDDAEKFGRALTGDHPVKTVLDGGVDPGDEVRADPDRITQVLRNLLGNAAKHTPEGTPIEVQATPAKGGGRVRIEVRDSGPGIHQDDLRRIFEKFGRGRNSDGQRVTGMGLGLYLSRRIVQGHGSELEVSSAPGEGSVFSFELEAVGRRKA